MNITWKEQIDMSYKLDLFDMFNYNDNYNDNMTFWLTNYRLLLIDLFYQFLNEYLVKILW